MTDSNNFLRFATDASGFYRLNRNIAGTQLTLWQGTTLAVVGDVVTLAVTDTRVLCWVNGVLQADVAHNASALTSPNWGMYGNFSVDPTSALVDMTWSNVYTLV